MKKMREVMQEILPPKVCPACDTLLVWENDQLFCTNTRCSGKTSKKIKHFAKTLQKFCEHFETNLQKIQRGFG